MDRLKKVFSDVFSVDASEINLNSSPDNIEKWNSLNHMNLIIALEEEFKLTFSTEEIIEMLSYQLVEMIVNEKIS